MLRRFKPLAGLPLSWLVAALLAGCAGPQPPVAPPSVVQPIATGPRYVAVVDAGSSGSRLFLYRVQQQVGALRIDATYSTRDVPHALSWYDGTHGPGSAPVQAGPQGVGPLLAGLRQAAQRQGLPPDGITVHALATAGLRLVAPDAARNIHASVRQAIESQGFRVGAVGTISGQQEGLYSWADVNHLLGRFERNEPTLGIVEVGGASAQVAFAVPGAQAGADTGAATVPVTVQGRRYSVFIVSYLGLGQNEARQAMLQAGGGAAPCYPAGAVPGPGDAVRTRRVAGAGSGAGTNGEAFSLAGCARAFAPVLAKAGGAHGDDGVVLAQVRQLPGFAQTRFAGVSAVHYAFKDWNLAADAASGAVLAQTLEHQCSGGVEAVAKVKQSFRNPVAFFQQHACAHGAYIHEFLFSAGGLGLDLPGSAAPQLLPLGSIVGQELNWTRGVVVLDGALQGMLVGH